jgi:hypothetical protein
MQVEPVSPGRSRRSMLAILTRGAVAALAAGVVRESPAVAGIDGDVVLGMPNQQYSGDVTGIWNTKANGSALDLQASGGGVALNCRTESGFAIATNGNLGIGLLSQTGAGSKPATKSWNWGGNTGIHAHSSANVYGSPPATVDKTAVYGTSFQGADARGVTGETTAGRGVNGIATSGTGVFGTAGGGEGVRGVSTDNNGTAGTTASGIASGVYGENTGGGFGTYGRSNQPGGFGVFGEATSGVGVKGHSTNGIAVVGEAGSPAAMAFRAIGRVKFSTSGIAIVSVGAASKAIKPGTPVAATTFMLCTLESNQRGLYIQRVIKNSIAGTFSVFLSTRVGDTRYARVGWFVLG